MEFLKHLDIIKEQNKKKITERAERDIPLIVFHDRREGVVIYGFGSDYSLPCRLYLLFILFLPICRFLCIYNVIYVMRQKSRIIACICILVF
jgi:hypothetical protein